MYFLLYSLFSFWYLCLGNISVLLKFLPFSFQATAKVSYCLPGYQKMLLCKEMCYLRNINMMPVVERQGRRENGFPDNFHFFWNLKRYVFVQVTVRGWFLFRSLVGVPQRNYLGNFSSVCLLGLLFAASVISLSHAVIKPHLRRMG